MISNEDSFFPTFDALIAAAPDADETPALPSTIIPLDSNDSFPVNARDLHTFLEVGKDFSNWIKDRIETFGFIKEKDFSPKLAKTSAAGGRPSIEYSLTLSMAKELSMVERNDRGKQARQYFIKCEEELAKASLNPAQLLNDPATLRGMLIGYTEQVIALENKVQELAPKAAGLDRIAGTDGTLTITESAKSLGVPPRSLFTWLEDNKWIYKRGAEWLPFQTKINAGVMDCKVRTFAGSTTDHTVTQARLTPKGISILAASLSA